MFDTIGQIEGNIGFGYDIHQLVPTRKLIIGGVEIDYHLGALAHSDGDVLIHALIDAILTGIGSLDIGSHFPDTDKKYAGIDSTILLSEVMTICNDKGYKINNVSITVILEEPKLQDYIPVMKVKLANLLKIKTSDIGIAAKTNEKLGLVGNSKAIIAFVAVSLNKTTD
ncbi:MAG TPA: 2-C-methyl-D-erythritol 2,4-cyclodiphosphate synthase [Clostridiales bacterium]|nr:2-C-methyl-D-erythritol 2,4-cyclodiphosphate synthase [Clostridiales bacterium]